jgi:hypothetical protein
MKVELELTPATKRVLLDNLQRLQTMIESHDPELLEMGEMDLPLNALRTARIILADCFNKATL